MSELASASHLWASCDQDCKTDFTSSLLPLKTRSLSNRINNSIGMHDLFFLMLRHSLSIFIDVLSLSPLLHLSPRSSFSICVCSASIPDFMCYRYISLWSVDHASYACCYTHSGTGADTRAAVRWLVQY